MKNRKLIETSELNGGVGSQHVGLTVETTTQVTGFAQVPHILWEFNLDSTAFKIYTLLVMCSDYKTGKCHISIEEMQSMMVYNKRNEQGELILEEGEPKLVTPGKRKIIKALYSLSRAGVIESKKKYYSKKRAQKTEYRVLLRCGSILNPPSDPEAMKLDEFVPQLDNEASVGTSDRRYHNRPSRYHSDTVDGVIMEPTLYRKDSFLKKKGYKKNNSYKNTTNTDKSNTPSTPKWSDIKKENNY